MKTMFDYTAILASLQYQAQQLTCYQAQEVRAIRRTQR